MHFICIHFNYTITILLDKVYTITFFKYGYFNATHYISFSLTPQSHDQSPFNTLPGPRGFKSTGHILWVGWVYSVLSCREENKRLKQNKTHPLAENIYTILNILYSYT